jgi:hypothetical protein
MFFFILRAFDWLTQSSSDKHRKVKKLKQFSMILFFDAEPFFRRIFVVSTANHKNDWFSCNVHSKDFTFEWDEGGWVQTKNYHDAFRSS